MGEGGSRGEKNTSSEPLRPSRHAKNEVPKKGGRAFRGLSGGGEPRGLSKRRIEEKRMTDQGGGAIWGVKSERKAVKESHSRKRKKDQNETAGKKKGTEKGHVGDGRSARKRGAGVRGKKRLHLRGEGVETKKSIFF